MHIIAWQGQFSIATTTNNEYPWPQLHSVGALLGKKGEEGGQ